jgi:hypothetical protein
MSKYKHHTIFQKYINVEIHFLQILNFQNKKSTRPSAKQITKQGESIGFPKPSHLHFLSPPTQHQATNSLYIVDMKPQII